MQILSLTSMYNKVYKMGCFEITNSMEIEYLIGDLTALFACVCVCLFLYTCIYRYISLFCRLFDSYFSFRLGKLVFCSYCVYSDCTTRFYMTIHFLWRRFIGSGFNTARTASSNTWMKETIMVRFCFQFLFQNEVDIFHVN